MNVGDIYDSGRDTVVVTKVTKVGSRNTIMAVVIRNKNNNIKISGVQRGYNVSDLTPTKRPSDILSLVARQVVGRLSMKPFVTFSATYK
jgi:hypothetical protein